MRWPSVVDQIDRLFDELVHRPWAGVVSKLAPLDIRAVDDGWVIELPVEGLEAGDLDVQVQGRQITVSGRRTIRQEQPSADRRTVRTRRDISLYRTFFLPLEIGPDDIDVSVEGATLKIHVRKRTPWPPPTRKSTEK
jgi:HSP20 family molecular chaperone IbpA